jgi:hypothetical protein
MTLTTLDGSSSSSRTVIVRALIPYPLSPLIDTGHHQARSAIVSTVEKIKTIQTPRPDFLRFTHSFMEAGALPIQKGQVDSWAVLCFPRRLLICCRDIVAT